MKQIIVLIGIILLTVGSVDAQIINGDFQTGSLAPWIPTGLASIAGNYYVYIYTGGHYITQDVDISAYQYIEGYSYRTYSGGIAYIAVGNQNIGAVDTTTNTWRYFNFIFS